MTRSITSGMQTAIAAPSVRPFLLFKAEFSSGWVRFWTGVGPLDWDGQTWQGSGNLISISVAEESEALQANGLAVTVSGVTSTLLGSTLTELRAGKSGYVYLGLFDDNGAIIADPKIIFRGRLDIGQIDDSDTSAPLIKLQYENELIDLERPREWRYTDEHQKLLYPGDTGLRYVESLQDKVVKWGPT